MFAQTLAQASQDTRVAMRAIVSGSNGYWNTLDLVIPAQRGSSILS
jgi:hypothetical protein